ncbi:MAG: ABC transporter ATP-binding protein/permease [Clostridia bacterium]|nr:ABC transporter ATP-binding protein/permease [Clostridia bacterium]
MLELIDIKKDYPVAGGVVSALKGVSIKFRRNELVSILGASGCGKTTLLNIIGGLDKYTSGDLIIEGKSTKQYKDGDWDTYRNHSIGFIFQSYHLIPHQTVLQNVELALLISGVSKEERRRRAIAALERVGLGDKLKNRPNQLSGGQAQRVAIARALINDPEIVLADEPTGALDSKTSVQIMELLKEIAKDRLVIMVTHNPELAEEYSTRIIRLLDGEVVDDTKPYDGVEETVPAADATEVQPKKTNKGKKKKASMSVGMAMSLSMKNLLSKRKRTALVSVAGSIGIIGVSMVLAISAGVKSYIADMENDMLSGYPLSVTETAIDFDALMNFASSQNVKVDPTRLNDKIYVDSLIETLMGFGETMTTNTITPAYLDYVSKMPAEYYNALQYDYGINPANNIYANFKLDAEDDGEEVSITGIRTMYTAVLNEVGKKEGNEKYAQFAQVIPTVSTFEELPDNYNFILSQYDILATTLGKTEKLTENELEEIFNCKDSVIMVVNDHATTDLVLGQYGYFTQEEFLEYAERADDISQGEIDKDAPNELLSEYLNGKDYGFFLDEGEESTFKWYPNDTIYREASAGLVVPAAGGIGNYEPAVYEYLPYAENFADSEDDIDLKVKIILQKKEGVSYGCLTTGMYYTKALTEHALETGRRSDIVKYINEQTTTGQLDGVPFKYHYFYDELHETGANGYPLVSYLTAASGGMMSTMMSSMMGGMLGGGNSDEYASIRIKPSVLGGGELPLGLYIYPLDFDSKDSVTDYLDKWNDLCAEKQTYVWTDADGAEQSVTLDEQDKVNYTDQVGLIITMVNTMIEMITIALIAFTALSLVVSTVMIGIITYVSVVERIKEIGILRAVGARKKDIKRLFNAETFIIGLAAGIVGIVVTYIISLILNLILGALVGIFTIASLPIWQALIMICVSVVLTLISGLIPAAAAAKKDPVVALRTE